MRSKGMSATARTDVTLTSSGMSATARTDVTLVIAPKDWYSLAVEQLRAVLQSPPVAAILYLVSPPHPPELDEELAVACKACHANLRVLRHDMLVNPYAMR